MGLFSFLTGGADRAPELGLMVGIEKDGFTLKAGRRSTVNDGDSLLVAYKTAGSDWTRTEVEYRDEPRGMFVYTGSKPTNVLVLARKDLQARTNYDEIPAVSYSSDRGSGSSSCTMNDLLNPLNPLSPLSQWQVHNPLHFLNLFRSEEPQHPQPDAGPMIQDVPLANQELGMRNFRNEPGFPQGALGAQGALNDNPFNPAGVEAAQNDFRNEDAPGDGPYDGSTTGGGFTPPEDGGMAATSEAPAYR